MKKKQVENKQLLHTIRKKKTAAENLLTEIIRQFSNRNNPLQEPEVASNKFHVMSMDNQRPLIIEKRSCPVHQIKTQTPNL